MPIANIITIDGQGKYNSGEFFIKRPAGTGENGKMGNTREKPIEDPQFQACLRGGEEDGKII